MRVKNNGVHVWTLVTFDSSLSPAVIQSRSILFPLRGISLSRRDPVLIDRERRGRPRKHISRLKMKRLFVGAATEQCGIIPLRLASNFRFALSLTIIPKIRTNVSDSQTRRQRGYRLIRACNEYFAGSLCTWLEIKHEWPSYSFYNSKNWHYSLGTLSADKSQNNRSNVPAKNVRNCYDQLIKSFGETMSKIVLFYFLQHNGVIKEMQIRRGKKINGSLKKKNRRRCELQIWKMMIGTLFSATAAIPSTVQIECASESIIVHISTEGNSDFHGLVYPRGLSKNSSCLQEYRSQPAPITYNLPLRSCNTMPTELVSYSCYHPPFCNVYTINLNIPIYPDVIHSSD